jgi:hypothetical protein
MTQEDDWSDLDPDDADTLPFKNELLTELTKGHELFASNFVIVARRHSQDDILVTVDGRDGCAAIHLTWKRGAEHSPYPRTTWFKSADQAKTELREEFFDGEP